VFPDNGEMGLGSVFHYQAEIPLIPSSKDLFSMEMLHKGIRKIIMPVDELPQPFGEHHPKLLNQFHFEFLPMCIPRAAPRMPVTMLCTTSFAA
jgi:hypothetical protein